MNICFPFPSKHNSCFVILNTCQKLPLSKCRYQRYYGKMCQRFLHQCVWISNKKKSNFVQLCSQFAMSQKKIKTPFSLPNFVNFKRKASFFSKLHKSENLNSFQNNSHGPLKLISQWTKQKISDFIHLVLIVQTGKA